MHHTRHAVTAHPWLFLCAIFSTPLITVHMSHRLALLGCLGIVASASLMQSTACSGEQDAKVPAGEDDH